MLTLDEVIEQFEKQMEKGQAKILCVGTLDSIPDVLHYLRELQLFRETPVMQGIHKAQEEYATYPVEDWNPALTWDELRQMEGKPVWVEVLEATDSDFVQYRWGNGAWYIVKDFVLGALAEYCQLTPNRRTWTKQSYGEAWQAYRKERS